jgi:pimeloyl-ACP methyl ester carboxylesterase
VAAGRLELTIVFVNYRGYGASEGEPGLMVGRHDALRVYDELQGDPAFAGLPLLVQGQSIGVTFAAYVATERPVRGLMWFRGKSVQ